MILWETARIFISMPERPPIQATGRVAETLEPGRLYRVEMANGYLAYAVLAKLGPQPENGEAVGHRVGLEFSPFDMSRCHLVSWLPEDA